MALEFSFFLNPLYVWVVIKNVHRNNRFWVSLKLATEKYLILILFLGLRLIHVVQCLTLQLSYQLQYTSSDHELNVFWHLENERQLNMRKTEFVPKNRL